MKKRTIFTAHGPLTLSEEEGKLVGVDFIDENARGETELLQRAEKELLEYFAGKREAFSIPLAFHGTDFQRRVWEELLKIPYGETRTYKEIATAIGHEKAVRAVGSAVGKNPIAILIPCHRVLPKSGGLGGFSGGLTWKRELLRREDHDF